MGEEVGVALNGVAGGWLWVMGQFSVLIVVVVIGSS